MKRRDFVRAGGLGLLLAAVPGGPHLPWIGEWWQGADASRPLSLDTLESYQSLLDSCWALCDAGEWGAADRVARRLMPKVAGRSGDQPGAAVVATRALLLISVVSHHQLRLQDKVSFCQQAVEYGRQSGDATALVSALIELAVAFRYLGQHANALATHVEALAHVDGAAPLVRSRAYSSAAGAFAQGSMIPEAARYVQLAYEAFPADPEADPHWLGDTGVGYLSFHEGRALVASGRPAEAEQALERYKEHPKAGLVPERMRLDILNQRARAAVAAGDLDLYSSFLRSGLEGALAIGSGKRYDEIVSIHWEEAPADWRGHPTVSQVAEEFGLDRRALPA